jgi:septum formation protein
MQVSNLVLASASPFRRSLLKAVGVPFRVLVAPIDERQVFAPTAKALASARALAKAQAVAQTVKTHGPAHEIVIGCDQVLEFDGEAFDKVTTLAQAKARLKQLSGKTHYLHSAYVLVLTGQPLTLLCQKLVTVPMPMRPLTASEIKAYAATGEWQGSVGCYQFENRGHQLFEVVKADQAAIIGLPLQDLLQELRRYGLNFLLQPGGPWTLQKP